MSIIRYAGDKYFGLSGDSKPSDVIDGATFYEADTKQEYLKVNGNWMLVSSWIASGNTLSLPNSGYSVGIGTSNPQNRLDVVGNVSVSGNILVTGTVDGVDIASLYSTAVSLSGTSHTHINKSNLDLIDQSLATSGTPSFKGAAFSDDINLTGSADVVIKSPSSSASWVKGVYLSSSGGTTNFMLGEYGTGAGVSYGFIGYGETPWSSSVLRFTTSGSIDLKTGTTIASNLVWHSGNDGSGSGLDADLLDGYHSGYFSTSGHTHAQLHTHSNITNLDVINQSLATSASPTFAGATIGTNGNALSILGSTNAWIGFYPYGIGSRKGYIGFGSSTNSLQLYNETATGGIDIGANGKIRILNSDLDVSNNILVGGLVDGVDISALYAITQTLSGDSHTHANKSTLDVINQQLATSSTPRFSGAILTGDLTASGKNINVTAPAVTGGWTRGFELEDASGTALAKFGSYGTGSNYTYSFIGWGTNSYTNTYLRFLSSGGLDVQSSSFTVSGNPVWHAGNDGTGSSLDADLLDGQHIGYFATSGHTHTLLHSHSNSGYLNSINQNLSTNDSPSFKGTSCTGTSGSWTTNYFTLLCSLGAPGIIQGTAAANSSAGYGAWLNYNAYYDGNNWIQPRLTTKSLMFTSNNHLNWSFRYAAPAGSGCVDNIVVPVEVASINTAGTLMLSGGLIVGLASTFFANVTVSGNVNSVNITALTASAHTHTNKNYLDTIDQSLGTTSSPSFNTPTIGSNGNALNIVGSTNAFMSFYPYGIGARKGFFGFSSPTNTNLYIYNETSGAVVLAGENGVTVQLGNLNVNNSITVGGTVDGVDVSALSTVVGSISGESHSHSNKINLDTVSQSLATNATVQFGTINAKIFVADTRNDNPTPSSYNTNRGVLYDFKRTSIIGLTGTPLYAGVMTVVPWGDKSGGAAHQIAFNDTAGLFWRTGTLDSSSWNSWLQLANYGQSQDFAFNSCLYANTFVTTGITVSGTINGNSIDVQNTNLGGNVNAIAGKTAMTGAATGTAGYLGGYDTVTSKWFGAKGESFNGIGVLGRVSGAGMAAVFVGSVGVNTVATIDALAVSGNLSTSGNALITGNISVGGTVDGVDISQHAGDTNIHHTHDNKTNLDSINQNLSMSDTATFANVVMSSTQPYISFVESDLTDTAYRAVINGGNLRFDLNTAAGTLFSTYNSVLTLTSGGTVKLSGIADGALKLSSGVLTGGVTTSDIAEGTNLYFTAERADARITAQKGVSGGIATLGSDSKVPASQLPSLAIMDTYTAASSTEMLALSALQGDICVRTDISKSYILKVEPASSIANWQELLTPADSVTSVNTKTGAITLTTADINEVTNLYYTDGRVDARIAATSGSFSHVHTNKTNLDSINQNLSTTSNVNFGSITGTKVTINADNESLALVGTNNTYLSLYSKGVGAGKSGFVGFTNATDLNVSSTSGDIYLSASGIIRSTKSVLSSGSFISSGSIVASRLSSDLTANNTSVIFGSDKSINLLANAVTGARITSGGIETSYNINAAGSGYFNCLSATTTVAASTIRIKRRVDVGDGVNYSVFSLNGSGSEFCVGGPEFPMISIIGSDYTGYGYLQAGRSTVDTDAKLRISRFHTETETLAEFCVYSLSSMFTGKTKFGSVSGATEVVDVSGNIKLTGYLTDGNTNLTIAQISSGLSGGTKPASAITYAPTGSISSTNVQTALAEVDREKFSLTGNQTISGYTYISSAIGENRWVGLGLLNKAGSNESGDQFSPALRLEGTAYDQSGGFYSPQVWELAAEPQGIGVVPFGTAKNYLKLKGSFNSTTATYPAMTFTLRTATDLRVGIGTETPTGALEVTSTSGGLIVPRMGTAAKNAIPQVNGTIVYNSETGKFLFMQAGTWSELGGSSPTSNGFASGDKDNPGVYFTDFTNTGLFMPASGAIGITTAGVERVRVGVDQLLLSIGAWNEYGREDFTIKAADSPVGYGAENLIIEGSYAHMPQYLGSACKGGDIILAAGSGYHGNDSTVGGDGGDVVIRVGTAGWGASGESANGCFRVENPNGQTLFKVDEFSVSSETVFLSGDSIQIFAASGEMYFKDSTGTYSLSDLAAGGTGDGVKNIWITAASLSEGNNTLSDATNWNVQYSLISSIKVKTTSTDWDLYLCETASFDTESITTRKLAESLSGAVDISIDKPYNSDSNNVYLKFVDNVGSATFDVYITGESRSH